MGAIALSVMLEKGKESSSRETWDLALVDYVEECSRGEYRW